MPEYDISLSDYLTNGYRGPSGTNAAPKSGPRQTQSVNNLRDEKRLIVKKIYDGIKAIHYEGIAHLDLKVRLFIHVYNYACFLQINF